MHHIHAERLPLIRRVAKPGRMQEMQLLAPLMDGYPFNQNRVIGRGRRLAAELDNAAHIKLHSAKGLHNPDSNG